MNERSKLLEIVFSRCSKSGGATSSLNGFFVEVLKLILPNAEIPELTRVNRAEVHREIDAVRQLFADKKVNYRLALYKMQESIANGDKDFLDTFMYNKTMREIELLNYSKDNAPLTCLLICKRILMSPTGMITQAITMDSSERQNLSIEPEDDDETIKAKIEAYKKTLEKTEVKPDWEWSEQREVWGDRQAEANDEEQTGLPSNKKSAPEEADEEENATDEEIDDFIKGLFGLGDDGGDGNESRDEEAQVEERQPTISELMDKVEKVHTHLSENVFGQDHAVSAFVSGFFQAELTASVFKNRDKPRATFLFAGPPGVGKTFLSELAAEALGLPFRRFDMTEYNHREASIEFCGSDRVYKNGSRGNVTGFVSDYPRSVLLFDEIEKADISVIYLFLQMLDAGRLRDNYTDEEVSFRDAIIILTTNAGKRLYEDESINLLTVPKKTILKSLESEVNPLTNAPVFPAAICSRFASGNVVMFNRMQGDFLLTIAEREMHKQCAAITEKMGVNVSFDKMIPYALLFSEGGKADARTIKAKSIKFVHNELYDLFWLLRSDSSPYSLSSLTAVNFAFSLPQESEIVSLFDNKDETCVLVFASREKGAACRKKLKGVTVLCADSLEEAKELIQTHEITLALCDIVYKIRDNREILNREDVHSLGMDFFDYVTDRTSIPVYIIQESEDGFSKEEIESLSGAGAGGIFDTSWTESKTEGFINQISLAAHLKNSMTELARANKVLSFSTAQMVKNQGKEAVISLYDYKLTTAVEAEDNEGILNDVSRPLVRFDDVIGANDAKGELKYFIDYLKDPVKYVKRGIKAPKGILLYGPPGTGKTMLAKAMAGESNVTFIKAEGNQFLKRYVGQGVENVHKLFTTARKYAPSILFIDEIDAIAMDRQNAAHTVGSSDVLTAFLTEMDGFNTDGRRPVFVLAATNFSLEKGSPKSLDPALLRRFDRRIYIGLPDREERTRFIDSRLGKIKNHSVSREEIENLALRSTGSSLADLDSVIELALRNVIKSQDGKLSDRVLEDAFETFSSGEVKKWRESELLRTARHEAGHAVVCRAMGEKPSYLTIVARASHGGYMQHGDNENKGIYTRQDLLARVRIALGGRAAEIVYYGEDDGLSSGASGDLQTATAIMQTMICDYGMDEDIGLCTLKTTDITASEYYSEIVKRINEGLKRELALAKAIIKKNTVAIDRLARELMSKNSLKGDDIERVLKGVFVE